MSGRHIKILGQALALLLFAQLNSTVALAQDAIGSINSSFSTSGVHIPTPAVQPIMPLPNWPVRKPFKDRSVRRFILLGAGVYAAATFDMRESLSLRPRFHEDDPLAKPLAHLPAPAYLATGAAFATGVNWIAWKMARSERWRSVWWLAQLCSIAGNVSGYAYTRLHARGP